MLLEDLRSEVKKGHVAIVVGAGVTMGATQGAPVASWTGLLAHGIERCHELNRIDDKVRSVWRAQLESKDIDDLINVGELVSRKLDRPDGGEYPRWLRETVGSLSAKDSGVIDALGDLGCAILTTNYDDVIEQVTRLGTATWANVDEVQRCLRGTEHAVLHLHGHWKQPKTVVLGVRSYEDVLRDEVAQAALKSLALTKTLLFVGFGEGLRDPNLGALLEWMAGALKGATGRHFRLALSHEREAIQRTHPSGDRTYVLSYGDGHADLAPFLRTLAPSPAAPRPTRVPGPGTDTGVFHVIEPESAGKPDRPRPYEPEDRLPPAPVHRAPPHEPDELDDRRTTSAVSTAVVARPEDGESAAPRNDCMVVIYTKEPTLLGKRFVLDISPLCIGRGSDNHIILEGDSVSRRHAHIEQRGTVWWTVDNRSTNGTYVNDEQIGQELALANGDRIKVGPTIFKYLSGNDVEAQYHEEIYQMTIIDGLTQAHLKRYALEVAEKAIRRCRKHREPMSLLMFDIDRFKQLNDFHGSLAGDFVLRELARVVQSRLPAEGVLSRFGGDDFCILLPRADLPEATALAEKLRELIQASQFIFQGDTIPVTTSFGVTELTEGDRTPTDMIQRADARLHEAKRMGRNRVAGAETAQGLRRPVEAEALIERMKRAGADDSRLLAFEFADDAAVRAALGALVYEKFQLALLRSVQRTIDDGEPFATWQDRIVIVASRAGDARSAQALSLAIEATFRSLVEEAASPTGARSEAPELNCITLPLATFGDRPASELIDHLLARLVELRKAPLPVPLALRAHADARPDAESRCNALRAALERGLAYLVAAELAAARESENAKAVAAVRGLEGADLTLADWSRMASALAPFVPRDSFVVECANGLRRGDEASDLAQHIDEAVTAKRHADHGASRAPETYEHEERILRRGVDALLDVMAPLARRSLVAVAKIVEQVDDELSTYELWELHGLARIYARRTVTLPWRLRRDWCYILDGEKRPLLLAPLFFAKTCAECKELEVAWVRRVTLGVRGHAVEGRGISTDHVLSSALPANDALEALSKVAHQH